MVNDLTVNKLILIYILSKTNIPIDSSELADFMIQNEYADYFSIQQYFADLIKSDFIYKISQDKKTYLMITESGTRAADYFMNRIPKDYYDLLDIFCLNILRKYDDINIYDSFIVETENDKYSISCTITKNGVDLLSIKLSDLTKEKSKSISEQWKNAGSDIYMYIKEKLGL